MKVRTPPKLAEVMSRRLLRLGVPQCGQADPLLAWAAWHLDAAQAVWNILQRATPHGDQNFTGQPLYSLEFAAHNLVCRGVVSAMDVCAGAIFRLTGQPLRSDRERDVGFWLSSRSGPVWAQVPPPLQQWLRPFARSKMEGRGRPSRSVHAPNDPPEHHLDDRDESLGREIEYEVAGARHNAADVMPTLLKFGMQRYSAFERALARAYPLR